MRFAVREADVEQGVQYPRSHVLWEGTDEQSVVSMSNYVAGVLLFLFLAGLLPLSLLVLASVLLVCLATCIRAYVMHQLEQRLGNGTGISRLSDAIQVVQAAQPLLLGGQQLDLQNLQLSLVQRDFGESDYESLLALDASMPLPPAQQVSDALFASLPSFKHSGCRMIGGKPGEERLCSVCLDPFADGARLTQLSCKHSFHCDCIQPWLRQQGKSATCPLCKAAVWPHL